MFKTKLYPVAIILSVLALVAGACAPSVTPPTTPTTPATPITPTTAPSGMLKVYVTDAPPREEVTSIMVTVSEVQVHKAVAEQEQEQEQQQSTSGNQTQEQEQQQTQQGGGEWLTLDLSDNATTFDLLQIRGIEQYLGANEVDSGKYTQVRLVVDKVQVKFGSGNLTDAEVPSKELKIVHPFDIVPGETTALVLDFDADKMVTVTGGDKIIVKPVIKLTVKQEKPEGDKGTKITEEEEPEEETAVEASLEVSCDDFMNTKHISREIEVNAGDSFRVTLCSNPTTGFQWTETANITDGTVAEQVKHKFTSSGNKQLAGAAGQEIWTFKALKTGTTTISMEYSRPWQGGEKGEWTFQLTVTVK